LSVLLGTCPDAKSLGQAPLGELPSLPTPQRAVELVPIWNWASL